MLWEVVSSSEEPDVVLFLRSRWSSSLGSFFSLKVFGPSIVSFEAILLVLGDGDRAGEGGGEGGGEEEVVSSRKTWSEEMVRGFIATNSGFPLP